MWDLRHSNGRQLVLVMVAVVVSKTVALRNCPLVLCNPVISPERGPLLLCCRSGCQLVPKFESNDG
jgi:hypothetical protein